MSRENPFVVYSPEDITPKEFRDIFVKEHTWVNALETPKDYFVIGIRGSGKSMLLNFLEFSHQLYYFDNKLAKFLGEDRIQKYIGIMVHATHEELKTDRYELLLRNNLALKGFVRQLCMNDLVMAISHLVLRTLLESDEMCQSINDIEAGKVREFCKKQLRDLDKRGMHSLNFGSSDRNTRLLGSLAEIFLTERRIVEYYANDRFQVRDAVYEGNYSTYDYLHSFVVEIRKLLSIEEFTFHILIDNGDQIKETMQLCIDSLLAQRQHRDICFKVAVKKGSYWNMGDIQSPHDYSQIDIDELYSTQHSVYHSRIREIASKRLVASGVKVTVDQFFPESQKEAELLQTIKSALKKTYEEEYDKEYGCKPDEKRPSRSEYTGNRVNKYAKAELFRRLKKTGKSYAGFVNLVHLSSGIIRQFLDICSYIFEEEVIRKGAVDISEVSVKTQNDVIKRYADHFMDELEKEYKILEKKKKPDEAKVYRGLYNLIEALGNYYKERLMNPRFKEPRVFTFTLKDPGEDPEVEGILDVGVAGIGLAGSYFQTYWYSSKTGLGKYRGYAFNRRLCPRYVIDHTSFRGRIELKSSDLLKAIETRKLPKSVVHYDEEKRAPLDLFVAGEEDAENQRD